MTGLKALEPLGGQSVFMPVFLCFLFSCLVCWVDLIHPRDKPVGVFRLNKSELCASVSL